MRWLLLAVVAACTPTPSAGERRPAGTAADPVAVCTRAADVCRLDGARLGVCVQAPADSARPACAGGAPCWSCMAQH